MQQTQILIPMDAEVFWQKIRETLEDVLNERDARKRHAEQSPTPHLLKVKEVCDLFQISKPTIYDWIRKGQLRSVKIESRRFFLASDIEEMIGKNREGEIG